jgi:hypothetical protein
VVWNFTMGISILLWLVGPRAQQNKGPPVLFLETVSCYLLRLAF